MSAAQILATLGFMAATVPPAAAQQHRHDPDRPADQTAVCRAIHGMMTMGGMMSGPRRQAMPGTGAMMEVMRFNPSRLLTQRSPLGLDSIQVARLEQLARGLQDSAAMQTMMATGRHLGMTIAPDSASDPVALRDAAEAFTAARARVMTAHIVAAAHARELLSEEQRSKVKTGMPQCPGIGRMGPGVGKTR